MQATTQYKCSIACNNNTKNYLFISLDIYRIMVLPGNPEGTHTLTTNATTQQRVNEK